MVRKRRYGFIKPRLVALFTIVDGLGHLAAAVARAFRPAKLPGDPQRILLVNFAHIGDLLLITPALRVLREAAPRAHIAVLAGPWSADLLAACPYLDEILVFRPSWWDRQNGAYLRLSQLAGLVRLLRRGRFELSINFKSFFQENMALWLAGIPARMGYGIYGGGFFLSHRVEHNWQAHTVEKNLALVSGWSRAGDAPSLAGFGTDRVAPFSEARRHAERQASSWWGEAPRRPRLFAAAQSDNEETIGTEAYLPPLTDTDPGASMSEKTGRRVLLSWNCPSLPGGRHVGPAVGTAAKVSEAFDDESYATPPTLNEPAPRRRGEAFAPGLGLAARLFRKCFARPTPALGQYSFPATGTGVMTTPEGRSIRKRVENSELHGAANASPLHGNDNAEAGQIHAAHRPEMFVFAEDVQAARDFLRDALGGQETSPLFAFHIGAGYPSKRWGEERYAALADALAAKWEARIVVVGGPDDVALVERMQSLCQTELVVAAGKLGIRAMAALLSNCRLFVGNDSAPAHIAAAIGLPAVAVFSGENEANVWRPYADNCQVIQRHPDCYPCGRRNCHRDHRCMADIPVEEVLAAVERILAADRPS